jgi:enterochelin esterase family protein
MSGSAELAIQELILAGPTPEAVDGFLAANEFPIREGPHTTFVYQGAATSVLLGHWLFGTAAAREMERVPDTDLWFLTLDLPAESRVEYRFQRVRGTDAEWILDPLNERTVRDPFGVWSICHGEGYRSPDWTAADPLVGRGELSSTHVRSRAFGTRRVSVYTPFGFRNRRRYPLLVVLDGDDYLRHAACRTVLDNLIHRREIPPLIAAFVSPEKRIREYADNPAHAEFLTSDLVPHLQREFPVRLRPDDRGLVGAGLGAVAALTAAWRYPGFFGKLLLSSGSFTFTDVGPSTRTALLDPVVDFVNAYRVAPGRVSNRVFVSCGIYEPLIYENRSLVPLLRESGMEVRYVEAPDGHNWDNWRDRLRVGLSWLFPGPLWLYYR